MSDILNNEKIQTSDIVFQKDSRTTVECDIIVPDVKPDILKVLEVSGYISVAEKVVRSGKIYIQGTAHMNVLYAPDGEVSSRVKNLSASQDFTHTIDAGGADGELSLSLEVEPEGFNYTLINSRKLNLRCVALIGAKLSRINELEFPTSAAGDKDVCTKAVPLRLCSPVVNSEGRLVLCTQLDLPSGKPAISEILKTSAHPQSLEFSFAEDKAIAEGQVRLCFLYTSLDDGSVQLSEHTVPFSETLDAVGAEEDMEGEIEYSVSDIYCEVRDDSDGEPRVIGIDLGLCAVVRGFKTHEIEVISDAYSLCGKCNLSSKEMIVEQLIDNSTANLTHKASVTLPDGMPQISRVCDVSVDSSVDGISVAKGEITVSGSLRCNVLYIAEEGDVPLGSFSGESDFTHTFSVPAATENTVCDAKIYTEHTSYTLNGTSGIDLRAVLGLSVRSHEGTSVSAITDISVEDDECTAPTPYITIYFVKHGDSLWKIAKKYHTTVSALMECNGLTSDNLAIGQQIKICR